MYRDSMLENVPLHRDVMAAWSQLYPNGNGKDVAS